MINNNSYLNDQTPNQFAPNKAACLENPLSQTGCELQKMLSRVD